MFEPGHLHIARPALQPDDVSYDLHVRYDASQTDVGPGIHFTMEGEINGKGVTESFDLPKDLAYNFASTLSRLAQKHGLPKTTDLHDMHGQYDAMFEDIRDRLDLKSGDPVKPEHLE